MAFWSLFQSLFVHSVVLARRKSKEICIIVQPKSLNTRKILLANWPLSALIKYYYRYYYTPWLIFETCSPTSFEPRWFKASNIYERSRKPTANLQQLKIHKLTGNFGSEISESGVISNEFFDSQTVITPIFQYYASVDES